jgi:serine/threonine-protein kinase
LTWVDRAGRETALPAPERAYAYPRISPDGNRVALDIRDQERDIWIWYLGRETLTRFTFDPAADILPVWTPDGKRIAFQRAGQAVFWQAADGTGAAERLLDESSTTDPSATAFTDGGRRLVFHDNVTRGIKVFDLDTKQASDLIAQSAALHRNADISPDGRLLAYQSNESGTNEIYVRPFPDIDAGKWQVSRAGGTRPLWAPSGRELFYLAQSAERLGGGDIDVAMMAVPIAPGPGFRAENPVQLFTGPYFAALTGRTFDVSQDGKRFLMIKGNDTGAATANRSIIVVENFFEELKRRAAAN